LNFFWKVAVVYKITKGKYLKNCPASINFKNSQISQKAPSEKKNQKQEPAEAQKCSL
jgi:hypothetical protein